MKRLLLTLLVVFASGFIAGGYLLGFWVAACAVCVARWGVYAHRPRALRRYFLLDPHEPDAKSLADVFSTLVEETQRLQKTIILRLATFTTDPRFRPRLSLTHDHDIELSGFSDRQTQHRSTVTRAPHKKYVLQHPRVWLADHPLPFDIPLTRSLTLIFSPCAGSRVRVTEDTPPAIPRYVKIGMVVAVALACCYNLHTLLAALLAFIGETYLMRQ